MYNVFKSLDAYTTYYLPVLISDLKKNLKKKTFGVN